MEQLQSAYKPSHSPESALWKVEDDILQAIDNDQCVILLLLDLSAVFGTVHHHILVARLTDRFGIDDKAHSWFKSYLSGQMHFAAIGSARSSSLPLNCGFPQRSVLDPILYLLYGDLLGDTMRHQNVSFHFNADDEQLYVCRLFRVIFPGHALRCKLNLMTISRGCWFSMLSTVLLPSSINFK